MNRNVNIALRVKEIQLPDFKCKKISNERVVCSNIDESISNESLS